MDDPDLLVLAGGHRPQRRDDAARAGQRDGADADRGDAGRLRRRGWRHGVFRGAGPGGWTGGRRRAVLAAPQTGICQILDC